MDGNALATGPKRDTTGPVLVVATGDTAVELARALEAAGVSASPCPWADVEPPPHASDLDRAITAPGVGLFLLTSANALRFVARGRLAGGRAACVGAATAAAARRAGCIVDTVGSAGGRALALDLIRDRTPTHVLWLRGERANPEGAATLRAAGWTVDEVIAYTTRPRPDFAAALGRTSEPRAYLVGSLAAGEALVAALGTQVFPPPRGGAPVFVLGEASAKALAVDDRPTPVGVPADATEAVRAVVNRLGR